MPVRIVTYATKPEGTFEQLVNNKYGLKIDVIGMGEQWNGFLDKTKGYLEYCKKCKPDDIVVCVDGYDTEIINDPSKIEELFKSFNCDIVMSVQPVPMFYFYYKIFGSCKGDVIMNSGLYAGYASKLAQLLELSLQVNSPDDQTNLNSTCNLLDGIEVDIENKLFFNDLHGYSSDESGGKDAIFRGVPGTVNYKRMSRMPREYMRFFILEIFTVFSVIFIYDRRTALYFIGTVLSTILFSYIIKWL